jgi:hypothetical protein
MTSPYLDRPLLPLAVALPRMLEKIKAELTNAGSAEKLHLRQREELIRGLFVPSGSPTPPRSRARPRRLGSRSSGVGGLAGGGGAGPIGPNLAECPFRAPVTKIGFGAAPNALTVIGLLAE